MDHHTGYGLPIKLVEAARTNGRHRRYERSESYWSTNRRNVCIALCVDTEERRQRKTEYTISLRGVGRELHSKHDMIFPRCSATWTPQSC